MAEQAPPSCFGKEWDEDEPECSGGLDPLYLDPDSDTSKRPRCSWFGRCKIVFKTQRNENTQNGTQQQVIPAHHLVRPPFVAPQQQQQPTPWASMQSAVKALSAVPQIPLTPARQVPIQVPSPPIQHQQQPQMVYHQQQLQQPFAMVPPPFATMPHYVPMNYTMPGAQVPSFLTVPESPDQSWGSRLAFMLIRGIAKAAGLIIANFFDHTPITPWKQPQQPQPQNTTHN